MQATAFFQQAVHLYRGDFLVDLRQRRRRKGQRIDSDEDYSGREWFIVKQDELQSVYLDALHKLGRLLFQASSFAQAAEVYRLAAVKDDYDDVAQHGLMHCLALQGKRSQALEQYRKLLKRRSDTPPGSAIVELAERLKRGEELAPKVPAGPPQTDQNPSRPFKSPLTCRALSVAS